MERVIQPLQPAEPDPPNPLNDHQESNQRPPENESPSNVAQPQTQPPTSPDQVPVGASASSLGLSTSQPSASGRGKLIKLLIITVVLVVLAGGGLVLKNMFSGLGTKTLSNGDYTYNFKFFKPATLVRLDDGPNPNAYKHLDSIVGGVAPSKAPTLMSCSQIGSKWTEAFKVNVYNKEIPVCTPNQSSYSLYFTALGHQHLFTITYKDTQNTADVQPKLEQIFESISVTQ